MEIQTTLIDYNRIYKAIDGLSDVHKDKVIKQGLKAATGIFVRAGRTNLRSRLIGKRGTGNLAKSFKNKIKRRKLGSVAGFSFLGSHAHLLDRGTNNRYTKKGFYRGKMKGNSFWTDAIESNESAAISKVYEGIERGINKIIMRN